MKNQFIHLCILVFAIKHFCRNTEKSNRTVLIYVTHINDTYQHERVSQLSQTFGQDFVVAWDNRQIPKCPFHGVTCMDDIQISSTTYDMKHAGHGNEKAMTWAIRHRKSMKRVWIMEEDVHYTDISILKDIVQYNFTDDLLTQRLPGLIPLSNPPKKLIMLPLIIKQWQAFDFLVWPKSTMCNFYAVSQHMLDALNKIYIQNNKTWMFFEGMLPTTADYFNLTTGVWSKKFKHLSVKMKWRPCVTSFEKPGIYHPAKHRGGRFVPC